MKEEFREKPTTWFDRAMTWEEFLAEASNNVERMKRIFQETEPPVQAIEFFRNRPPLKILVIGEDWCPDVVQNLALLAKLCTQVPSLSLRILRRDENPEIMERYLTGGKKRIPVVIFFDENYRELGSWRGRCQKAQQWIEKEVLNGRSFSELSKEEVEEFNRKYDRLFAKSFKDETINELTGMLKAHVG